MLMCSSQEEEFLLNTFSPFDPTLTLPCIAFHCVLWPNVKNWIWTFSVTSLVPTNFKKPEALCCMTVCGLLTPSSQWERPEFDLWAWMSRVGMFFVCASVCFARCTSLLSSYLPLNSTEHTELPLGVRVLVCLRVVPVRVAQCLFSDGLLGNGIG